MVTNLSWPGVLRENIYIYYVCIVLCACICINTRILGFFSPYPQIALPLLGDMGALFKVLWLCKKLCVNFQEKSERKSLREFELIA